MKLRITNYRVAITIFNLLKILPWRSKKFDSMIGENYGLREEDVYYLIEFRI